MDPTKRRELEERRASRPRCEHGVTFDPQAPDRGCAGVVSQCRCCGLSHCHVDGGSSYDGTVWFMHKWTEDLCGPCGGHYIEYTEVL